MEVEYLDMASPKTTMMHVCWEVFPTSAKECTAQQHRGGAEA